MKNYDLLLSLLKFTNLVKSGGSTGEASVSRGPASGPEVIKLFFVLSSAETKIYPANKC